MKVLPEGKVYVIDCWNYDDSFVKAVAVSWEAAARVLENDGYVTSDSQSWWNGQYRYNAAIKEFEITE